ncbi:hypothetical protein ACFWBS_29695 [Streptomyces mirabilis]|uniref:hypothetical protein n=1 Tax=Streptomyces mirabilis TaxID=68239 RepID=UPI003665E224
MATSWARSFTDEALRRRRRAAATEAGRKLLDAATPAFENELRTWLADPLTARSLEQLATTLARRRGTREDGRVGMPTG